MSGTEGEVTGEMTHRCRFAECSCEDETQCYGKIETTSSGNNSLLRGTPSEAGYYWFRDNLNGGPWLICEITHELSGLFFEHGDSREFLNDIQAWRHYDFAGPVPEPAQ